MSATWEERRDPGRHTAGGSPGRRFLTQAWPLAALFLGFPLWWFTGLSGFIFPILAIPMALSLLRGRRLVMPGAFGIWLLFLLWVVASGVEIDRSAAWLTYLYRISIYLSATVTFLYVLNTRDRIPSNRIAFILTGFWVIIVAFGWLALAFPHVAFASLMEQAMRALNLEHLLSNSFLFQLVHPRLSQVQDFLGHSSPRPTAPFLYTNNWGGSYALLLPFVFASFSLIRSRLRKLALGGVLALSVVPVVVAVDRGSWICIGVAAVYVIGRSIVRLDMRAIAVAAILITAAAILVLGTPLGTVVSERLAHPHSDDGRALLYTQAVQRVWDSPLLGFGGPLPPPTNHLLPNIGTQGQFWLVLISNGIPGAALFMAFFAVAFVRSRGGGSDVRYWAHLSLLIFFVAVWVYEFIPVEIHLYMIAAALAWRESLTPRHPPPVRAYAAWRPEHARLPVQPAEAK
jgi:hypothetical protein